MTHFSIVQYYEASGKPLVRTIGLAASTRIPNLEEVVWIGSLPFKVVEVQTIVKIGKTNQSKYSVFLELIEND